MFKAKTINDLPIIEKPREKLIKYGPEKLLNKELLAIILRTGKKGKNAIELAASILDKTHFKLPEISITELQKMDGLGPAKASEIVAAIELGKRLFLNKQHELIMSPHDVWKSMHDINSSKKEHFVIFFLDSRNQEIKREIISVGTVNTSLVHPREVFEPAVRYSAVNIVFAHNHPTGILEPSIADIEITKRLIAASKILGIDVIDHVLTSNKWFYSMKEKGDVEFET